MWHTGVEAFYVSRQSGGIFCVKPEQRRSPRHVGAEAFFESRRSGGIFRGTLGLGRLFFWGGPAGAEAPYMSGRSGDIFCVTSERKRFIKYAGAEAFQTTR